MTCRRKTQLRTCGSLGAIQIELNLEILRLRWRGNTADFVTRPKNYSEPQPLSCCHGGDWNIRSAVFFWGGGKGQVLSASFVLLLFC